MCALCVECSCARVCVCVCVCEQVKIDGVTGANISWHEQGWACVCARGSVTVFVCVA